MKLFGGPEPGTAVADLVSSRRRRCAVPGQRTPAPAAQNPRDRSLVEET
jgi:hypothetical protein